MANQIAFYPQSSGGTSGGIQLISKQTLGSAVLTVTFSAIPQTYTNLKLVYSGQSTSSTSGIFVNMNSDTGANYNYVVSANNGGTIVPSLSQVQTKAIIGAAAINGVSTIETSIINYSATVFPKGYQSTNGITDGTDTIFYRQDFTGAWNSTAAITRLDITIPSDTFKVGSVFSLYGMS